MCEFRNEINFLVEHTSCSSYVRMIVLTKYCKMVNRGVYIETPWLVRECFLFLGNYFFFRLYFCYNSCLNVINLDIWECVCLWDCWNGRVKINSLGTGVDYFVHIFQCMSFCWWEILDSFSAFGNEVVLAGWLCWFLLCPQSPLMSSRHGFSSFHLYRFHSNLTP